MNAHSPKRIPCRLSGAALLGILVLMSLVPEARATTITGPLVLIVSNGAGNLIDATVTTTTPSGSLGNTLTFTEDLQASSGPGVRGDFQFALIGGPAGSTQYLVTGTFINNTGNAWFGFQILMGCDFGFTPCSPSGEGPVSVDFGLMASPAASLPATLDLALPYLLRWSGMRVGNGEQVQFLFGIRTFDCGPGPCSASWQISAQPDVPEPGTLILTVSGGFLLLAGGRLRRRRTNLPTGLSR